MKVKDFLRTAPGVTSVVGSGGKTTLLPRLAGELEGTVILTTTTHILPFPGTRTLLDPTEAEVAATLEVERVICVASTSQGGKLAEPGIPPEELARLAGYVLVEADGSRRLPLKAHAPYEPVIPFGNGETVLVVGASGLGHPASEVVHRPETFCSLARSTPNEPVTPEHVARVICAEHLADHLIVNQADTPGLMEAAREIARLTGMPTCAGSIRDGDLTEV